MSDPLYWTEAQIALVEQARDAAQTSARRAQEALGGTSAVVNDVRQMRDRSEEILSEVATRQAGVEDTIAANIPGHEWDDTSLRLMNPDGGWGNYVDLKGETGAPPTLQIGDVETLPPGQDAVVTIVGNDGEYELSFSIPNGAANELTIGDVTTVAPGGVATATITGESPSQVLNLGIPAGAKGDPGTTDYTELDNLPTLGTAAAEDVGAFATAAEGALANTALQPSDIGTSPGNVVEVGGDGKIADVLLPESSGGASSADIIRLAIDVATLKGDIVMLASGLVDSFEGEDGVDTAGSVDEQYDAVNLLYHNDGTAYVETVTSLPAMSGNNAPAGHVASASSTNAGAPYNAFDQTLGDTYWQANAGTGWVRRQTPSAITVGGYKLTNRSSTTQNSPTVFTFEGSNNGADWDVLDTRSGLTWSAGETKSFTVTEGNRAAYSYHRLNITTSTAPGIPLVAELELLQELITYVMDLRSVAWSALSAPATGRVTIAAKGVGGTITPDTDLIAYVSRDDGTTWTQANLTAAETTAAGFTFYSGDADISGQPSGTDMKWRVVTGDAFEVQVGTVALSWE